MSEYPKKRYGVWLGNPAGRKYRPENCAEEVKGAYLPMQCSEKAGHGDRALFCEKHANPLPEVKDNE